MNSLHIETPLVESIPMAKKVNGKVWLKLEALQPSGSFKIRGIGNACQAYIRMGAKKFVSSSGGNAGIAVAYSGRKLGLPVTVVVPKSTTERAIEAIKKHKAVYLMAVGGAAYLVSKAIRKAKVIAFEELGMEAIHEFEVEEMPVTVAVDVNGISVHQTGPEQWKAKIAENRVIEVS